MFPLNLGLERGPELNGRGNGPDLSGCRRVYFSTTAELPNRWRIVYIEGASAPRGTARPIQVVAVGARNAMAVYKSAAIRLAQQRLSAATLRSRSAYESPSPDEGREKAKRARQAQAPHRQQRRR
ncbi:hypothetical protein GCM10009733_008020 [Nonomuraea maheshkhaliensis]|uniref:Uncharacterized protein n=1 Tax=Nonomuraea maheshkhaliensis TaxID=419590 RepID=A0ABN2EQ85_9ACTN